MRPTEHGRWNSMSPLDQVVKTCGFQHFLFNFFLTYWFIFGRAGSSLPQELFSSCGDDALVVAAGLSLQWLPLLQLPGSRAEAQ